MSDCTEQNTIDTLCIAGFPNTYGYNNGRIIETGRHLMSLLSFFGTHCIFYQNKTICNNSFHANETQPHLQTDLNFSNRFANMSTIIGTIRSAAMHHIDSTPTATQQIAVVSLCQQTATAVYDE